MRTADLTTALETGAVLLSVREGAGGRYRIDEQEQEYLWLTGPEQSHLQALVSRHNADL